MRYSTIVEKDDKTLLEIIDMLEQFEKDKFIAGLQMRHYSLFQIEQTLDMVCSYQARMNIESRALVNFSGVTRCQAQCDVSFVIASTIFIFAANLGLFSESSKYSRSYS